MWEWFKNLGKNLVAGIVGCGKWMSDNAGKIACTSLVVAVFAASAVIFAPIVIPVSAVALGVGMFQPNLRQPLPAANDVHAETFPHRRGCPK